MDNYKDFKFKNDETPKYVQVANFIKTLIDKRKIKEGDKLPTIRELSKKLQDVNYDEFGKNSKEFKDKFFDFRINYPELFPTQIYKKTLDFFKALSENSSEFEAGELSRSIKTNES